MAANLQLSRNTHVFLQKTQAAYSSQTADYLWQIPVLDGYSFSQAVATSEITLNEMARDSNLSTRRARAMFNDALEPAEWSFTTYMRPNNNGTSVDESLWANMLGDVYYDGSDWQTVSTTPNGPVTRTGASQTVSFDTEDSNYVQVGRFNLFFVLGACGDTANTSYSQANGQTIYRLADCVVNSAAIEFDIDGIAQITWSGFGTQIEQVATANMSTNLTTTGISSTKNFIKNRLTQLTVVPGAVGTPVRSQDTDVANEFDDQYYLTLTGGSISFENNISFLTPEELCKVNIPIGHVTGTRSISGSFTCYLDDSQLQADGSTAGSTSSKLFKDLVDDEARGVVQNDFNLVFDVGGTAGIPRVQFNFANAHLEIPNLNIEDVISLETSFHALPTSLDGADEAVITYVGPTSL
mgnify:CR=1 FL=1|tara:strand:- start:6251 stop:7480 length:1230 start_codon:yes stop_codon:yes gene_type:complete